MTDLTSKQAVDALVEALAALAADEQDQAAAHDLRKATETLKALQQDAEEWRRPFVALQVRVDNLERDKERLDWLLDWLIMSRIVNRQEIDEAMNAS